MLYMVIERFKEGAAPEIYQRFREKGRMMPEDLEYVSSWIDLDFKICYHLTKTEDFRLFDKWIDSWRDLMEFEIITSSSETAGESESNALQSRCTAARRRLSQSPYLQDVVGQARAV